MTNPYQPASPDPQTEADQSGESKPDPARCHFFAGWWLVIVGLISFGATNYFLIRASIASTNWSPLWIVGLGLLIVLQVRPAITLARFVGTLAVMFMVGTIPFIARHAFNGDLTTVTFNATNVSVLDMGVVFVSIAAAIIPPWWALQRALWIELHFGDTSKPKRWLRET